MSNVTGMEDLNGGLRITFSEKQSFDVTEKTITDMSKLSSGNTPKKLTAELQKMLDSVSDTVQIHVYSISPLQFTTICGQYIPKRWWDGLQPEKVRREP